ncbi:NUDIX hydrolase [Amycolatopsis magusensis]|uniref:8-oxo-dGTP pyrophosphatase MutT (NUDIX family) n=1 Tax=Amycolatopsis magusensis TaxID=882444 RepID=A0ABS4PZ53_9PSEU|nr:NUDIX hydrolase [Amycolatopsis magusensis]MBP2184710.1 8-oxo-dGTP pyrophosphatase MutT (NUDIX family) [Amycolatopsis magusensis]
MLVRDEAGNALLGFHGDLRLRPLPLALVVVESGGLVLMMLNAFRRTWELPGGMLEPGESPAEAALRELAEETGIRATAAEFATVAEFALVAPVRREYGAVYRLAPPERPRPEPSEEALDFRWWDPAAPVPEGMSPLDAAIARHTTSIEGPSRC